jgi:Saposin-like type B, region 2
LLSTESELPAPDHQIEVIGEMLSAGLEASQICSILGLCVAVEENHIDECGKCIEITSSIQQEPQLNFMWNNQYSVCQRMTNDEERAECQNFVQVYAGELTSMLVNGMTPIDICYSLNMCQNRAIEDDEDLFDVDSVQTYSGKVVKNIQI